MFILNLYIKESLSLFSGSRENVKFSIAFNFVQFYPTIRHFGGLLVSADSCRVTFVVAFGFLPQHFRR